MHPSIFPIIAFITAPVSGPLQKAELRAYCYVSPQAQPISKTLGLSEEGIIRSVEAGLRARRIHAIDPNRVYEGSEDALRIDIRPKKGMFVLELSVRQGVSVHNMLQRWAGRESFALPPGASTSDKSKALVGRIEIMLDRLKANFQSQNYSKGAMMEP